MKVVANCVVEECDSTNSIARILGEQGYPHGTWVSSRVQTSGRGRMGNQWQSLEGNLFLSVILRDIKKSQWSWIPLATAVFITKYLRETFPKLNIKIKWPNDIYAKINEAQFQTPEKGLEAQEIGYGKLGGILCEGVHQGENSYIIVGIGLNCLKSPQGINRYAVDLSTLLASECQKQDNKISADQIRAPLLQALLEGYRLLSLNGLEFIIEYYEKMAVFPKGSLIQWGALKEQGKIEELGPSGELIVHSHSQGRMGLFAEEIHSVHLI